MSVFPRLVLIEIAKHLSIKDVANWRRTCRRFNEVAKNQLLWEYLTKRDFGGKIQKLPSDADWTHVYRQEYDSKGAQRGTRPAMDSRKRRCTPRKLF